jgi:nitrate reductase / nitrite oxidoreductase, alpha subunit
VPRADAIRVAREFADNAEQTRGKSMIFLGAGTNHWFHSDMIYRAIINLTTLCGCQGVNGGGWAHYVGQEKVRPQAAWSQVAFGLDWRRPPRQQNGTSFYYFASDQWRYDTLRPARCARPWPRSPPASHMADYNVIAARLGWLPSYPQFNRNPLDLVREAERRAPNRTSRDRRPRGGKAQKRRTALRRRRPRQPGQLSPAAVPVAGQPAGGQRQGPRVFSQASAGHRSCGVQHRRRAAPEEVEWREPAPEGKLDLLVTLELRMSTSAMYADIALPAAGWYEMHDLNTTDMHPFIHPFNPAIDPPWETRTNWEQFKTIAEKFSALAAEHLGPMKDLVATPLLHDSPGEIAQPEVKDWRKGQCEPRSRKTMPALTVVTRDFPNTYKMMTALGPLAASVGVGSKGIMWPAPKRPRP